MKKGRGDSWTPVRKRSAPVKVTTKTSTKPPAEPQVVLSNSSPESVASKKVRPETTKPDIDGKASPVYNVQVSNSFDPISDNESLFESDMESLPSENSKNNPSGVPLKKPPPIIIHKHVENSKALFKAANDLTNGNIEIKCTNTKIVFLPKTQADHKKINQFIKTTNLPHHTYPLQGETKLKVVLKGLSLGIEINQIKEELAERGHAPEKIIQIKSKEKEGSLLPIYICIFPAGTKSQEIFKINRLCYVCVKWEKYKNNLKYIQCYRCLSFNHISTHCCGEERCLNCSGPHKSAECTSNIQKCANCRGTHKANDPVCPSLQKEIEKREQTQNTVKGRVNSPPTLDGNHFPSLPRKRDNLANTPPTWVERNPTTSAQAGNLRSNATDPRANAQTETAETLGGLLRELKNLLASPGIIIFIKKALNLVKALTQAHNGNERMEILLTQGLALFD